MPKKRLILSILSLSILVLFLFSSCNTTQDNQTASEYNTEKNTQQDDISVESQSSEFVTIESTDIGETTASDNYIIPLIDDGSGESSNSNGMEKNVFLTKRGINYVVNSGPFVLTINSVQIADIKVSSTEAATLLGIEVDESAALFAVDVTVENTSNDTMYFYPDQSTVVTNTKEQVAASISTSDVVGGAFMGNVVKDGQVYFICKKSTARDLTDITWYINSPHDSDLNHFGEELKICFKLDGGLG